MLIFVMCFALGATAFAESISPMDTGSGRKTCTLTISSGSTTCTSSYVDTSGNTTKILIEQTLQKQGALWLWFDEAGPWHTTIDGGSGSLINHTLNPEPGTYRIKAVFTVTDKDGKTESVTMYSTTQVLAES